ncbi:Leucine--tRNA ligase [Symmachiella macrocystis]|uniref:Leucine--tRNA ligase n=1 Tax=Symmachiella macrocystis TaxID=2527985 RepID=A0A5C6BRD1_9PLAN|nr:leucine--tRNA ligase [Symmachiella macrocystis]TWU14793.1 Leucine--tRNA ligase [Symmachiella macrocystis]
MPRYDAKRIEPKWQAYWEQHKTFAAPKISDQPKLYVLDMFPYPSGDGLHVGHPEGYTATDIVCRYSRMRGKAVLHPMGWDAFGLPAEQHAIKTGTHPRETTYKNIGTFRRQLKMLGFSYDWDRELATTDEDFFRWTQWIFLELFDTWFDEEQQCGRPIAELPIPEDITAAGDEAVRRYQDKNRLAYQTEAPVNWCPALGTVLANEEVIGGVSERGGHPVTRIPLRQWMLRITSYAERLLNELEEVNWPDSIKALQRNWIGRSEGAEVDFYIGDDIEAWKTARGKSGFPTEPGDDVLRVYTTRPDTLYGATYMVLAPEHPVVDRLATDEQREAVVAYRDKSATKSDLDRTDLAKEKSGVFTGSYAINPVNGEQIPIWIADYVLISYGTGAIMAVPAHDLRDWEFAVTFDIEIRPVVQPPEGYEASRDEAALATEINGEKRFPFAGLGTAVNSAAYDGMETAAFKTKITEELNTSGLGRGAVNYRLRDWLFSRQHFWGEPFPIWHELDDAGNPTGLMRAVEDKDLPVTLPDMSEFKPHGRPEPPLAEAGDEWLYSTAEDGTKLVRETNSMPQWAGSCWYYLRYIDPKNSERFVGEELEKFWMPVDLYIGGAEHAVLHLLYARFWHKVLFDRGYVSTPEPFDRLVNQGMILGEAELTAYQTADGSWLSSAMVRDAPEGVEGKVSKQTGETVTAFRLEMDQVDKQGNDFVLKDDADVAVESRSFKMSKSRGNVINPDEVVDVYGADALRLYEMFMGPLEQTKPWNMSGVEGVSRFLARAWRMIADDVAEDIKLNPAIQAVEPNADQLRILHKTIQAVSDDCEKLSFNTAISRLMEFTNHFSQQDSRPQSVMEAFVLMLSPFAPHLAEELWELLGHGETLAYAPWPEFDPAMIVESEIEIPVQVNGKKRAIIRIPAEADPAAMQAAAEADETVQKQISDKKVVKVIAVPGRMVNFVVR